MDESAMACAAMAAERAQARAVMVSIVPGDFRRFGEYSGSGLLAERGV